MKRVIAWSLCLCIVMSFFPFSVSAADEISTFGRVTQGVRLINLKDDQKVSTVALVDKVDDSNGEESENKDLIIENTEETKSEE